MFGSRRRPKRRVEVELKGRESLLFSLFYTLLSLCMKCATPMRLHSLRKEQMRGTGAKRENDKRFTRNPPIKSNDIY